MQRYRSGGTPWTIIIDRGGIVRFNDFDIAVEKAAALIDQLRATSHKNVTKKRVPRSRGGQDMLGQRLSLAGLRWLNGEGNRLSWKAT